MMREKFSRETSLSKMAQSVNLSPSRLRYLFKCQVGMPPAQYLKAFRMERARELLETTFLSVKQIRSSIGVNDHSHFIREFKKSYGVTPAQYRIRLASAETRRSLEGLLILIVDDDKEARERIGTMLEHAGACVTTMASARTALAALQRMRPHVLIIDLCLPDEDAYELIRKARALFEERGEQIPAVALAPQTNLNAAAEAISAGFQIHRPKPPGSSQLIDVVAKLTGRIEA
jgi:YesN/AraC family two-component response regulator